MFEKFIIENRIKKLEKSGYTVELFCEIRSDRLSSFWYKGEIAKITKGNQSKTLFAEMEIKERLIGKTGEIFIKNNKSNDKDIEPFYSLGGSSYHIGDYIYCTFFKVIYNCGYADGDIIDNLGDFFNEEMFSGN